MSGATARRKLDHVRINLEQGVTSSLTTGLEHWHFEHRALPDLDLDEVSTETRVFGRHLKSPLMISSMTGGAEGLTQINRILAVAAQERRIAMGVGSQRSALEDEQLAASFQVRRWAPDALLMANLGAAQLAQGYGVDACRKAVDMLSADALILHFNPLQEAVQTEGDTRWRGLLTCVEVLASTLPVPIVAKEVGWGIGAGDARRLVDAGVAAIDVAGAGGTSWTEVEKHRAPTAASRAVAGAFIGWGNPTANCIVDVRRELPDVTLIASGGLRDGLDVAKAIGLGADMAGLAAPFLHAAVESEEAVVEVIDVLTRTLRIAMFATGLATIEELRGTPALRPLRLPSRA